MKEIQNYLKTFQKEMKWDISDKNYREARSSMLNNYMLLTTEVGEVAEEFRAVFNNTNKLIKDEGYSEEEAFIISKGLYKESIGKELSDCIAYIVKFANYFDIDIDNSFYGKRSEEHTSELQSRGHLVCRLLLEKKK